MSDVLPNAIWADDDLQAASNAVLKAARTAIDLLEFAARQVTERAHGMQDDAWLATGAAALVNLTNGLSKKVRPLAAELIRARHSMGAEVPVWYGVKDRFALGAAIHLANLIMHTYMVDVLRQPETRKLVIAQDRDTKLTAKQRRVVAAGRKQLAALAKRADSPAFAEVKVAVEAEVSAAFVARHRLGSPSPPVGSGRGRKKADDVTEQSEADLAKRWAAAHEAGVYKGDFVRDHRDRVASVKDLNLLLARVRGRKRRANK